MLSRADSGLDNRARQLLQRLTDAYDPVYGLGCFSCAIYDTAWVAMVSKVVNGQIQWLFPSSFRLLLNTQQPDGGWESDLSEVDGILNTMAATLALRKLAAAPCQLNELLSNDLETRISKAISYLRSRLVKWDIQATVHVGYEILIPALLDMLAQDGASFQFDGKRLLMTGRDMRMSKLDPDQFYGNRPTTALHSLEAFIGRIDFDRLAHHETLGSMMASPSSTAAYLMHCSTWRSQSEAYLHQAISAGEGKGNGGVPSAFPSTLFETTWVISTLLQGGFTPEALGSVQLSFFTQIFEQSLRSGDGLVGFAPLIEPDADDTAKIITCLNLLGRTADPRQMVAKYETQDHFKTYAMERDPSLSTNCNVLYALLHTSAGSTEYGTQIEKAVKYLCNRWWRSDDKIIDKWNMSPFYTLMLMSQALMQVLVLWDRGLLLSFPGHLLTQVSIVLFQALARTLQAQNSDGSWGDGHYCEETSYAILILVSLMPLPLFHSLISPIWSAVQTGRLFIYKAGEKPSKPERLWIEKVTYGSIALSESYILAALKIAPSATHKFGINVERLFCFPEKNVTKFTKFYKQLPQFAGTPEWWVEAAVIEGYQFLPQLKELRLNIFARKDMEEDKYFEYIPSTWTASNALDRVPFGASFLFDMMVISFLNYQADEYMEAVVGVHYIDRLDEIRKIIDVIFTDKESATANCCIQKRSDHILYSNYDTGNGSYALSSTKNDGQASSLAEVRQTLTHFAGHVLYHPRIQCASPHDRTHLAQELRIFLHAHITQIQDSARFSPKLTPKVAPHVTSPLPSFFTWVRATAADHTSCPYSFAFATCLLATDRQDLFPTSEAKYVAQAVCRHLATLCRMYNDYGSLARDQAEQNLNSVHFAEFVVAQTDNEKRAALWRIAAFERRCLDLALEELGRVASPRAFRFVSLFCRVTDMYGQIYVVKDIASRTKV